MEDGVDERQAELVECANIIHDDTTGWGLSSAVLRAIARMLEEQGLARAIEILKQEING